MALVSINEHTPTSWNLNNNIDMSISPEAKRHWEKLCDYLSKETGIWEKKIYNVTVNRNTPATNGQRGQSIGKILKNCKEGFNNGLWENAEVTAIPGDLVKLAIIKDPSLIKRYNIVESGYQYINNILYYISLANGLHRLIMSCYKANIDIRQYAFLHELPGTWKVNVSIANITKPEQVPHALQDATELLAKRNKSHINPWSNQECFFTMFSNPENAEYRQAVHLELSGCRTENGVQGVGKKDGIKVKITQYDKALKDKRLNDQIRFKGSELFKNAFKSVYNPAVEYEAIVKHGFDIFVLKYPNMRNILTEGHEAFLNFVESRLQSTRNSYKTIVSNWKKIGGEQNGFNSHHNEETAVALGIIIDFKDWLRGGADVEDHEYYKYFETTKITQELILESQPKRNRKYKDEKVAA